MSQVNMQFCRLSPSHCQVKCIQETFNVFYGSYTERSVLAPKHKAVDNNASSIRACHQFSSTFFTHVTSFDLLSHPSGRPGTRVVAVDPIHSSGVEE